MIRPLVSIITPSFNCADFLSHTIESVIAQTWQEWELIIVDDCSTDLSLDIAWSYARKDRRIKVFRLNSNSGPAVSRNTAIEKAQGQYIAFLDSDDLWYPQKLDKQIPFIQQKGYALTHTYYEKILESGQKTGELVCPSPVLSYADMLKSNQIGCLTAIYDTQRLGKVYMPIIRKRQDYGLWLKILKSEPFAFCLPEILAAYRIRTGSISSNKFQMLRYNWQLFRYVEDLSLIKSTYYLGWNIARKITT